MPTNIDQIKTLLDDAIKYQSKDGEWFEVLYYTDEGVYILSETGDEHLLTFGHLLTFDEIDLQVDKFYKLQLIIP